MPHVSHGSRGSVSRRASASPIEDMSIDELEAHIAELRDDLTRLSSTRRSTRSAGDVGNSSVGTVYSRSYAEHTVTPGSRVSEAVRAETAWEGEAVGFDSAANPTVADQWPTIGRRLQFEQSAGDRQRVTRNWDTPTTKIMDEKIQRSRRLQDETVPKNASVVDLSPSNRVLDTVVQG